MACLHVVVLVTSRAGTCHTCLYPVRVLGSPEPPSYWSVGSHFLYVILHSKAQRGGLTVCSENHIFHKMIQSKTTLVTVG